MKLMTSNDVMSFRVLLLSNVILGADFGSDIHFTLKWLEMRSWRGSRSRSMTSNYLKIKFRFGGGEDRP